MKLKTAKYMLFVFCLLMVVSLVVCSVTKIKLIGYLGIAFALLGVIFWVIFGRCPRCGGFLGRSSGKYCPHCGEKVDW